MATQAKDKQVPPNGGVPPISKGSSGKTNADMLKLGRGLAKVAAQKRGG